MWIWGVSMEVSLCTYRNLVLFCNSGAVGLVWITNSDSQNKSVPGSDQMLKSAGWREERIGSSLWFCICEMCENILGKELHAEEAA